MAAQPAAAEIRAEFAADELAAVLARYDIGDIAIIQPFPRGSHDAAKVMVTTKKGERYLLKRRPRGKDDPYRVAFAHELQNFLANLAFPLPHLVGTKDDNNSMVRREDRIYELFEFIPGEGYDNSPQTAREAGRLLALFHRLVLRMQSAYQPPPGHYHDSPRVRALMAKIGETLSEMSGAPTAAGQAQAVAAVMAAMRKAYDKAARAVIELGFDGWETQIVHNDWHPGNLLFQDQHVVAVLDFDASRIQPPVTDLANGALQFSLLTRDRNPDRWPQECDGSRWRAFIVGYDAGRRVAVTELDAIVPLMIEALVAECVVPIATAGHFAKLDGFAVLKAVLRKVQWLDQNAATLRATLPP